MNATHDFDESLSAEALEGHDPDAVDSDVAEVGASIACGNGFLKYFLEAGGLERVGIVPRAVHGNQGFAKVGVTVSD